ncbi:TnsA-like heteromeric transposase endonuclease subunit [Microbacterium testaceum]|uniref:TnsA-like heteromeric transposase endonuclease subunit n=1 Tax=Microbacterium testaceum TaxID=2033 RepID=UPI001782F260|nr:TnsA-like heteromeric transposase endonuclease subunit [Microbacterium testaceum]
MGNARGIRKSRPTGWDRIEWLDAAEKKHAIRADTPAAALEVAPGSRTRNPGKWVGQATYQGHYWCAGAGHLVFHESMAEYASIMLIDHLYDIVKVAAQPMLMTFANGRFAYPDYFVEEADGRRHLVDIHPKFITKPGDAERFALTAELCEKLGWRYTFIDQLSDVVRLNVELIGRYRHPRYAPDQELRRHIRAAARRAPEMGPLRHALATDKSGELMPALYHLMWRREVLFDLTVPVTDRTLVRVA